MRKLCKAKHFYLHLYDDLMTSVTAQNNDAALETIKRWRFIWEQVAIYLKAEYVTSHAHIETFSNV